MYTSKLTGDGGLLKDWTVQRWAAKISISSPPPSPPPFVILNELSLITKIRGFTLQEVYKLKIILPWKVHYKIAITWREVQKRKKEKKKEKFRPPPWSTRKLSKFPKEIVHACIPLLLYRVKKSLNFYGKIRKLTAMAGKFLLCFTKASDLYLILIFINWWHNLLLTLSGSNPKFSRALSL